MHRSARRTVRSTLLLLAVAAASLASAQGVQPAEPAKPPPASSTTTKPAVTTRSAAKQLDTGESLSYLGKKLWFEMRKRLNLTSEAEEATQTANERTVRLKLGSIGVEGKDSPPPEAGN